MKLTKEQIECIRQLHKHGSIGDISKEDFVDTVSELEAELAAVRSALEHDRTKVAECVTAVTKELQSYDWLISSRGSYSWDDNRWHGEFKTAHDAIETAIQPMVKIAADWSNCPKSWEEVQKAREGEGQ